jgi:glyoxylase-like metal-dependent hydrolase (beta-lactamase superfamily II)
LISDSLSYTVLERGWLSSNSVVFAAGDSTAVVDTGYCTHAAQSLGLINSALHGRPLDRIVNTHLHSDHCGGNAHLQSHFPDCQTFIPPGSSQAIAVWDEQTLSYLPTGQSCPRFSFQHLLVSGHTIELGSFEWEIHAAPGHDPDSIILFEPISRTLISADALWENGFGVVFPELEGHDAFEKVGNTLDLIEQLYPKTVIPGHGAVFTDVAAAMKRARSRLDQFTRSPVKHAHYAAKVLIKYKLLELQRFSLAQLHFWADQTPYFHSLHQQHFADAPFETWLDGLLNDLVRSGAMQMRDGFAINHD